MSNEFHLQLTNLATGKSIYHSGDFFVTTNGTATLTALTDSEGATLSQPVAFDGGKVFFRTADAVETVDVYGFTDEGYPFSVVGLSVRELNKIYINLYQTDHVLQIPISANNSGFTAGSSNDTGLDFSGNELVMPAGLGVNVLTVDATETLSIGTSGGSADDDGIIDDISVATAGFAQATVGFNVGSNASYVDLTGGDQEFTYGALMCGTGTRVALAEGSDVDTDEGFYLIQSHIGASTESIVFTPSAGTDTLDCIANIPLRLFKLATEEG